MVKAPLSAWRWGEPEFLLDKFGCLEYTMNYSILNRGREINHDEVSAFSVGERVVKKREKTPVKRNPFVIIPLRDTSGKSYSDQSTIKGNNREKEEAEEEEAPREDQEETEQEELDNWKKKQAIKKASGKEEGFEPAKFVKKKKRASTK